jgi:hypothetical protein
MAFNKQGRLRDKRGEQGAMILLQQEGAQKEAIEVRGQRPCD